MHLLLFPQFIQEEARAGSQVQSQMGIHMSSKQAQATLQDHVSKTSWNFEEDIWIDSLKSDNIQTRKDVISAKTDWCDGYMVLFQEDLLLDSFLDDVLSCDSPSCDFEEVVIELRDPSASCCFGAIMFSS